MLHKVSPCFYLHVWPFPSCDCIAGGGTPAPSPPQSCRGVGWGGRGAQQPSTVGQTNRRKESHHGRPLLTVSMRPRVGETVSGGSPRKRFGDANRWHAAFRFGVPGEASAFGGGRNSHLEPHRWNPSWSRDTPLSQRRRVSLVHGRTLQANSSNLRLLQPPLVLMAKGRVEDSGAESRAECAQRCGRSRRELPGDAAGAGTRGATRGSGRAARRAAPSRRLAARCDAPPLS